MRGLNGTCISELFVYACERVCWRTSLCMFACLASAGFYLLIWLIHVGFILSTINIVQSCARISCIKIQKKQHFYTWLNHKKISTTTMASFLFSRIHTIYPPVWTWRWGEIGHVGVELITTEEEGRYVDSHELESVIVLLCSITGTVRNEFCKMNLTGLSVEDKNWISRCIRLLFHSTCIIIMLEIQM